MREIKFRAWDKKNKKLRNIVGFTICDGEVDSVQFEGMEAKAIWNWRVDQYSDLMQYTGLKDKNEKEIYESDILKTPSGLIWEMKYMVRQKDDEDVFSPISGFVQSIPGRGFSLLGRINKVEVLGNIYENPELLKIK